MAANTGGVSYKTGLVAEAKPGFAKVRFPDLDGLVSPWLPVAHAFTLEDRAVYTLAPETLVACLLDEFCDEGVIVGALYSDADPAPTAAAAETRLQWRDGSSVVYDRASHTLTVKIGGFTLTLSNGGMALAGGDMQIGDIAVGPHTHSDPQGGTVGAMQ